MNRPCRFGWNQEGHGAILLLGGAARRDLDSLRQSPCFSSETPRTAETRVTDSGARQGRFVGRVGRRQAVTEQLVDADHEAVVGVVPGLEHLEWGSASASHRIMAILSSSPSRWPRCARETAVSAWRPTCGRWGRSPPGCVHRPRRSPGAGRSPDSRGGPSRSRAVSMSCSRPRSNTSSSKVRVPIGASLIAAVTSTICCRVASGTGGRMRSTIGWRPPSAPPRTAARRCPCRRRPAAAVAVRRGWRNRTEALDELACARSSSSVSLHTMWRPDCSAIRRASVMIAVPWPCRRWSGWTRICSQNRSRLSRSAGRPPPLPRDPQPLRHIEEVLLGRIPAVPELVRRGLRQPVECLRVVDPLAGVADLDERRHWAGSSGETGSRGTSSGCRTRSPAIGFPPWSAPQCELW